jgi:ABC-type sugar transport system substrate-binding protein
MTQTQRYGGPRRWLSVGLSAVGIAALAACSSSANSGGGSSSTAGSDDGSSASSASGSTGAVTTSIRGKTISLVTCSQTPWCETYNQVLVSELEAAGAKINELEDPFDSVENVEHLNQAIAQHPDLILLVSADARAVIPSLRQAQAAHIPVISLVPSIPQSAPLYAATITANMYELGVNSGKAMVAGLKKAGYTEANIIVITGTASQAEVPLRVAGFESQLKAYPGYKVISVQDGNWDPTLTGTIAQQLFAKYRASGGIQGAMGMNDDQAGAIIQAAKQAGVPVGTMPNGLVVTGTNCQKVGVGNIGASLEYGTSTQAPGLQANFTAPLVIKYLSGQKLPANSFEPEVEITSANLAQYASACNAS